MDIYCMHYSFVQRTRTAAPRLFFSLKLGTIPRDWNSGTMMVMELSEGLVLHMAISVFKLVCCFRNKHYCICALLFHTFDMCIEWFTSSIDPNLIFSQFSSIECLGSLIMSWPSHKWVFLFHRCFGFVFYLFIGFGVFRLKISLC